MRELKIQDNLENQNLKKEELYTNFLKNSKANNTFQNIKPLYNPIEIGKTESYNATLKGGKVERYKAYGDKIFEKVGYNPFIDNESKFNAATSWGDDFKRMTPYLWDNIKLSFFNYDSDRADAQRMTRNMELGSSTKGGFGGAVNNQFLSFGYTGGIILQMAVEEIGLMGITALSGGFAAPATGAIGAARAVKHTASIAQASKRIKDVLNSLKKADTAKDYYNFVKQGAQWTGRKAGDIFTPETYKLYKNWDKIKDLNDLAKVSHSATSFYRDVRQVAMASSEGNLEGWMKYDDVRNQLIEQYRNNNKGEFPTDEVLAKIEKEAEGARATTYMMNVPFIYLTDKITLGRSFKGVPNKFMDITSVSGEFFDIVKKAGTKAGTKESFEVVSNSVKSSLKRAFSPAQLKQSPIKAIAQIGKYTKENFAEGLQEWGQEVIGTAAEQRAFQRYRDGLEGTYNEHLFNSAKNFMNAEGLHTFASGFFMGTIAVGAQVGVGKITQASFKGMERIAKGDKYVDSKTRRIEEEKVMKEKASIINDLYSDPLTYFDERKEAFKDIATLLKQSEVADKNKDVKLSKDLQDRANNRKILSSLKTGTYDVVLEELKELSNLDAKELQEMFGQDGVKDIKSKVNKLVQRAEQLKKNYDYFSTSIKNPIKLTPDSDIVERTNYLAFEKVREQLILETGDLNRTAERMQSIQKDLLTDNTLKDLEFFKVSPLFDLKSLQSEIEILESETESGFDSTPSGKEIQKRKIKELKHLSEYQEATKEYMELLDSLSKETNREEAVATEQVLLDKMKKALSKYMQATSNKSELELKSVVEKTVQSLKDHYILSKDTENLSRAIAMMTDPETFLRQVDLESSKYLFDFMNRKADIENAMSAMKEQSENHKVLDKLLTDKNIFIEEKDLDEYLDSGTLPEKLYDEETGEEVSKERYDDAIAFIKDFKEPVTEETEEESQEETEGSEEVSNKKLTRETPFKELPSEVKDKLIDNYNDYVDNATDSGNDYVSIETWYKFPFPGVSKIIQDALDTYNKKYNLESVTGEKVVNEKAQKETQAKIQKLIEDGKKSKLIKETTDKESHYSFLGKLFQRVSNYVGAVLNYDKLADVTNIKNSLPVGNYFDTFARAYYNNSNLTVEEFEKSLKEREDYEQMSEIDINSIFEQSKKEFEKIKKDIEIQLNDNNLIFITDEIFVYSEFKSNEWDGVAGTLDMVVIDSQGIVHIYDFKSKLETSSATTEKSLEREFKGESYRTKWTNQQTAYARMLDKTFGYKPSINIIVIPVSYNKQEFDGDFTNKKEVDAFKPKPQNLKFADTKPFVYKLVFDKDNRLVKALEESATTTKSDIEAKKAEIEKLEKDKQEELTTLKIGDEIDVISSTGEKTYTLTLVKITPQKFGTDKSGKNYMFNKDNGGTFLRRESEVVEYLKKPDGVAETKYRKTNREEINNKYDTQIAQKQAELKALEETTTQSEIEKVNVEERFPINTALKKLNLRINDIGQILPFVKNNAKVDLSKVWGHGVTRGKGYKDQLASLDKILGAGETGLNSTIARFKSPGGISTYSNGSITIASKGETEDSIDSFNENTVVIVYDPLIKTSFELKELINKYSNYEFLDSFEFGEKYLKANITDVKRDINESPKALAPVTNLDIIKENENYKKYDAELKASEQSTVTIQTSTNQSEIEAKKADIEKLKKDKQEELKNSEINFEPLTTTVDGSWDKAKPINNELKNRFENSLQEGDKIITGNNEIIFFKNGKVVKRDGKDYGMSDIPTTAILTKGAKIDKTDSINAKYDAEIAQKQAEIKALEETTTQSTDTKTEIIQTNEPNIQTVGNVTFGTSSYIEQASGKFGDNQDAVYVDLQNGIFVLADGMGGETSPITNPSDTSRNVINLLLGNTKKTIYDDIVRIADKYEIKDFSKFEEEVKKLTGYKRLARLSDLFFAIKRGESLNNTKNQRVGATALKAVKTNKNTYTIEKVGDTVFFVVDKNGNVMQQHGLSDVATTQGYMFSIKDGKPFSSTPKTDNFTVTLNEGETLVLATDFIETDKAVQDFINSDFGKKLDFAKFQKENKKDDSTFITIKYDAELKALDKKEEVVSEELITETTKPKNKYISKIEDTSSLEELKKLETDILDEMSDIEIAQINSDSPKLEESWQSLNATYDLLKDKIEMLQSGLIPSITLNNIKVNDLVSLKNSKFAKGKVIKKTDKQIVVESLESDETMKINEKDIANKVQTIVNEDAVTEDVAPITKEEKAIINENKESSNQVINDELSDQALKEIDNQSKEELDNDFTNDLGCK